MISIPPWPHSAWVSSSITITFTSIPTIYSLGNIIPLIASKHYLTLTTSYHTEFLTVHSPLSLLFDFRITQFSPSLLVSVWPHFSSFKSRLYGQLIYSLVISLIQLFSFIFIVCLWLSKPYRDPEWIKLSDFSYFVAKWLNIPGENCTTIWIWATINSQF